MKKGIHIKTRLDECKKFDEECKYREISEKLLKKYTWRRGETITIFDGEAYKRIFSKAGGK